MKLTNKQILNLYKSLQAVGNLSGVKFSYAVAKNINKLKPEVDALVKAGSPSKEYLQYEEERVNLAKSHVALGEPQTILDKDGREVFNVKDQAAFDKDLNELREAHKDALVRREEQEKEVNELLEKEVEIELYTIPVEFVPDAITSSQMNGILPIIAEEKLQ